MDFYEFIGIGWLHDYPDWIFKLCLGCTKEQYVKKYLGYGQ